MVTCFLKYIIDPGKVEDFKHYGQMWIDLVNKMGGIGSLKPIKETAMKKNESNSGDTDKNLAAVCGLYCEACSLFIATKEDPPRLKMLASRYQLSEEAIKCYGCRAEKRGAHCETCNFFACAAERGIDFCVECPEYPCSELKQFQSERPHRITLWDNLEQIRVMGCKNWLKEIKGDYTCPECQAINSAYDLKCRKCGEDPSCSYVAKHKQAIEQFVNNL